MTHKYKTLNAGIAIACSTLMLSITGCGHRTSPTQNEALDVGQRARVEVAASDSPSAQLTLHRSELVGGKLRFLRGSKSEEFKPLSLEQASDVVEFFLIVDPKWERLDEGKIKLAVNYQLQFLLSNGEVIEMFLSMAESGATILGGDYLTHLDLAGVNELAEILEINRL